MAERRDIDTVEAFWPDEQSGPFLLRLYFTQLGERVECVGLELRSVRVAADETRRGSIANLRTSPGPAESDAEPRPKGDFIVQPEPLTPELFDKLPALSRVAAETVERSRPYRRWFAEGPGRELQRRLHEQRRQWREQRSEAGPGRAGYRPEHWYQVAELMARHASDPRQYIRRWAQEQYPRRFPAEQGTPDDSTIYRWMQRAEAEYPRQEETE